MDFSRSTFRVRGDSIDINLPYVDYGLRVIFFGDEIDEIERIEIETGKRIESMEFAAIFPRFFRFSTSASTKIALFRP